MANRDRVRQMDKHELRMYLMEQLGDEVADETLKTIEDEKINGLAFLALNDGDLHELIPSMGERKLVKLHLESLTSLPSTVSGSSLLWHTSQVVFTHSKLVSWQQCNKAIPSDLWRSICLIYI